MGVLAPGELLAHRFEVERAAGEGGMATVYRAYDHLLGVRIALKLLGPQRSGPAEIERFTREALLLSELHHPGIVSYVGHGQAPGGQHFIAMEWLEGEDLAQRLTRGLLPLQDALALLHRVTEALSHAHDRGIVHRDLKPTNLFLPAGDIHRVKILDFGIARRVANATALTQTGHTIGTPDYMAPEQVRGLRDITPAADVFALGCVLYECLTGRPPFTAEHLTAVLVRILFEEPAPLSLRRSGVPEVLEGLLRSTLQKDPMRRIPDASALRAALDGLGALAEPPITEVDSRGESQFATSEQTLITVVVAASEVPSAATPESVPAAVLLEPQRASLLALARTLGAAADFLLEGTLVATIVRPGSATDQANLAARLSLAIKERWPESLVAVATGRGTANGATPIGEVVDRATALLQRQSRQQGRAAGSSGVWLDELSAKLVGPSFSLEAVEGAVLVVSEQRDADASRPLLGKPTTCVGRDAELVNLEGQLGSCVEEAEARAVLITAPPGIGKSRLRHEFLRRVTRRSEQITLLLGRGDLMNTSSVSGILGSAIRNLCGVSGKESISEQRQCLRTRISRSLSAAQTERVVRFLGELAGVPYGDEEDATLQAARKEPRVMREQLRMALAEWIAAEAGAGVVLIVLDDLQWGDALSVSLIDQVLHDVSGRPLFVVAFARPEVHDAFPKLWQSHRLQEVPLKSLSRKACERLIQQVLGNRLSPEQTSRVIQQACGNALFLEEIIRAIAEGKDEEQPETIIAMLQGRIGRLSTGTRRTVRAASVFGQSFGFGGVAALLGIEQDDPDLEECLQTLVDAELIQKVSLSQGHEERDYAFRHALIRDAAYGLLTESDLALGHRLAGAYLEAFGEHDPSVIAEHHKASGNGPRAARFYLLAAERCLERGDPIDTLRHISQGLACAPEEATLGQLRSVESVAALWANDFERTSPGDDILRLLRPGSTDWYRAILGRCVALCTSHQEDQALELVRLLLQTDPEDPQVAAYIDTISVLIRLLAWFERGPLLHALERKLESCAEKLGAKNSNANRLLHMSRAVIAYFRSPRIWQMILDLQCAIELSQQLGDTRFELAAKVARLERAWLELGDLAGAEERMLAIEREVLQQQDGVLAAYWRLTMGRILCERSDREALERAEELVMPLLENKNGLFIFIATAEGVRARAALLRGELQRAEGHIGAAMEHFSRAPLQLIEAATVEIRIALALGHSSRALETAEKILRTVQPFGSLGVCEVELRVAMAEALYAVGAEAQAHAAFDEAVRQVQLRADDITDPAWRASYLARSSSCRQIRELAQRWGFSIRMAP